MTTEWCSHDYAEAVYWGWSFPKKQRWVSVKCDSDLGVDFSCMKSNSIAREFVIILIWKHILDNKYAQKLWNGIREQYKTYRYDIMNEMNHMKWAVNR